MKVLGGPNDGLTLGICLHMIPCISNCALCQEARVNPTNTNATAHHHYLCSHR